MSNSLSRRRATARTGLANVEREQAAYRAEVAAEQAAQSRRITEARKAAREAEKARPKLTADDMAGARFVRDSSGWHEVVRVNTKSVTVQSPWSWTDRIDLDRVIEVQS